MCFVICKEKENNPKGTGITNEENLYNNTKVLLLIR